MAKIDETLKIIDILKDYCGDNPYLLKLQKEYFLEKKDILNELNKEYILSNYNKEPKLINKTIKLCDWYSEKLKKDWGIDFLPEKLKISYLIGETKSHYHCLIKYRQNMDYIYAFLNKKGIITNFIINDYHDIDVNFDRYDKLSSVRRPEETPRKIKDHQKEAVQFLLSRKKCILAYDMGLGKTCAAAVAAIEGNFDSVLVICPASLKTNWFNELTYYIPEREISIIGGFTDLKKSELEKYLGYGIGKSGKSIPELQKEAKERGKWDENRFVIVNYDILDEFFKLPKSRKKIDIEESEKNNPLLDFIKNKKALIIIDEAHRLSNMNSQQYKIIKNLIRKGEPDSIYLITGTPITNNPQNYFNLLYLIDEPITDDWEYYMDRYCGAKRIPINDKEREKRNAISKKFISACNKSNWYELTDKEKQELNDIIKKSIKTRLIPGDSKNLDELKEKTSHIYLRKTKEDLGGLPSKYVIERTYDLTEEEQVEYNRLWEEYEKEKNEINPDSELNKELLEGGLYRKYLSNQMVPHTIKLTNKCLEKGEKVIIFCCYDEELYTLRDYYKDKCVIYNGKISQKEKDEAKNKFTNNPECMIFIGNLQSAGVGINLTSSRVVIFNNFSFVPGDCRQGEDRCYRIGQIKDVYIFYQFFKNTQYEKMWDTVLSKELVINQIIKKESEK